MTMSLLVENLKTVLEPYVEDLTTRTGLSASKIVAVSVGALTTVYVLINYTKSKIRRRKYKLPPGPPTWPILGNAIELSRSKLTASENFYHMAKDKYGPVILLNILGFEFVVLNNLDVVQEAMGDKQDDFANRPQTWSLEVMSPGGKDIILGQYGPTWKFHRMVVHHAVRKIASGKMLENVIQKSFDQVAEEIQRKEGPVEMREMIALLIFSTMASLSFGKMYELEQPEFQMLRKMAKEALEVFGSGTPADFMPSLAYCPLFWPQMYRIKSIMKTFYGLIEKELKEHQENYIPGNEPQDFIEVILEQKAKAEREDSSKKDLLDEEHLMGTIFDVFGTGIDTVNHTVSWFLIYMAKYPEIQERIRKEINEKWTADIDLVNLHSELTYTQAVLHEVMRLETIAPIGVPVATACDTSVGGYDVPKGTIVAVNLHAMHMSPEYWENPKEFNPNRFLEADSSPMRQAAFMPFGSGRRRCLGELLAKNQLMMYISLMLKKFEFSRPPGDEKFFSIMESSFANVPNDYHLVVKPRS